MSTRGFEQSSRIRIWILTAALDACTKKNFPDISAKNEKWEDHRKDGLTRTECRNMPSGQQSWEEVNSYT
jgi:hypothetical protein